MPETVKCANVACGHERESNYMMPVIDEGVRRYVCDKPCHTAFLIRKSAEKSYLGSDPT